MKTAGSDTEWRIKFDTTLDQYIIYADNKEVGHALDIDGVIDFIRIMQNSCEYSSNFCDNAINETTAESAAQKSQ